MRSTARHVRQRHYSRTHRVLVIAVFAAAVAVAAGTAVLVYLLVSHGVPVQHAAVPGHPLLLPRVAVPGHEWIAAVTAHARHVAHLRHLAHLAHLRHLAMVVDNCEPDE